MSYLAEHFEAAVLVLAKDGPVKERLTRAYSDHIEPLEGLDLPQKLSETFAGLQAAMHRVEPMGTTGSRVKASVQKMSAIEAGEHAAAIVRLYVELLRAGQRNEPLKVVDAAPAGPVAATTS